jgi:hypothetical protein
MTASHASSVPLYRNTRPEAVLSPMFATVAVTWTRWPRCGYWSSTCIVPELTLMSGCEPKQTTSPIVSAAYTCSIATAGLTLTAEPSPMLVDQIGRPRMLQAFMKPISSPNRIFVPAIATEDQILAFFALWMVVLYQTVFPEFARSRQYMRGSMSSMSPMVFPKVPMKTRPLATDGEA